MTFGTSLQMVVGIGVDAVDINRFESVLARRPLIQGRIFTEGELIDAGRRARPAQHLAVRFAAKEAVMKALSCGLGSFSMKDVEVVRQLVPKGAPLIRLRAKAAQLADERSVSSWHLSLTHTETMAVAMVVAEGRSRDPGQGGL